MNHVKSNDWIPQEVIDREHQEPEKIPTTLQEFDRLTYREVNWMHENRPALYDRFIRERRKEW